jgi:hypothetical protein
MIQDMRRNSKVLNWDKKEEGEAMFPCEGVNTKGLEEFCPP